MSKILLNLSRDVKEICEPYFKQLGLDHLNYIHRDKNGQVTYLCSNQKWLEHYLAKEYPKIGAFEHNSQLSKHKYILWFGLEQNDPILIDSKEMLGMEYGVTLIRQEGDGYGFYNIGAKSTDSSIINEYVNKLDQYDNFIQAFQEKADTILHTAKKLKLSICSELPTDRRKKLGYQSGDLYLTEREFQCVNYLSLGKTAEEIAVILKISKRTAESHIQNIKRKMNCYNQFRLGYLLGRMRIHTI